MRRGFRRCGALCSHRARTGNDETDCEKTNRDAADNETTVHTPLLKTAKDCWLRCGLDSKLGDRACEGLRVQAIAFNRQCYRRCEARKNSRDVRDRLQRRMTKVLIARVAGLRCGMAASVIGRSHGELSRQLGAVMRSVMLSRANSVIRRTCRLQLVLVRRMCRTLSRTDIRQQRAAGQNNGEHQGDEPPRHV